MSLALHLVFKVSVYVCRRDFDIDFHSAFTCAYVLVLLNIHRPSVRQVVRIRPVRVGWSLCGDEDERLSRRIRASSVDDSATYAPPAHFPPPFTDFFKLRKYIFAIKNRYKLLLSNYNSNIRK